MYRIVLLAALLALLGCTNVNQMHKLYLEGNDDQLYKIMEIVSRQDYPYATRRKAARILGEVGDRRAVPVLSSVLHSYEQRTTLKQDALRALGAIGDQGAAPEIGRLLDRSLNTADAELRMAAVESLGAMGGAKSAEILVNALSYYSILILRSEQRTQKGVFTGEEQSYPFGPAGADSTGGPRRYPNVGMDPFGQGGEPRVSMFGTPIERSQMQYNPTAEERTLAHDALVRVGEAAISEIENYMGNNRLHPTMRKELLSIITEIRGDPSSDTSDSTAVY